MIIKGLFRRYERWNPVHPTAGAFWGMGIGFGCGVGWGPGFGPETIGYVGAGCGVGFSVGITLAGFGVGLPTNSLIGAPFNGLVELARLCGCSRTQLTENGQNNPTSCISTLQGQVTGVLSNSTHQESLDETRLANNALSMISVCNRSFLKHMGKAGHLLFHTPKGSGE